MLQTQEMPDLGQIIRPIGYWGVNSESAAVPEARKLLSQRMANGWPQAACTAARVVATELLTNAVIHGTAPITLAINLRRSGLAIEVCDSSRELPILRENASMLDESGRGLLMVKMVSAGWGFWYVPGYKCVYAILKDSYEGI